MSSSDLFEMHAKQLDLREELLMLCDKDQTDKLTEIFSELDGLEVLTIQHKYMLELLTYCMKEDDILDVALELFGTSQTFILHIVKDFLTHPDTDHLYRYSALCFLITALKQENTWLIVAQFIKYYISVFINDKLLGSGKPYMVKKVVRLLNLCVTRCFDVQWLTKKEQCPREVMLCRTDIATSIIQQLFTNGKITLLENISPVGFCGVVSSGCHSDCPVSTNDSQLSLNNGVLVRVLHMVLDSLRACLHDDGKPRNPVIADINIYLGSLHEYLKRNFSLNSGYTSLVALATGLSTEQDDLLVAVCITLQDIWMQCEKNEVSVPAIEAHDVFHYFLSRNSYSPDLLFDYVISPETDVLLYLLTYLKLRSNYYQQYLDYCSHCDVHARHKAAIAKGLSLPADWKAPATYSELEPPPQISASFQSQVNPDTSVLIDKTLFSLRQKLRIAQLLSRIPFSVEPLLKQLSNPANQSEH